jgi:hypothetical protein
MAASTRGVLRDQLTFVLVNAVFAYGWNAPDIAAASGVSTADLKTGLGHMDAVEAAAISGVVMVTGANAPKPARVTKKITNSPVGQRASVSTFVAYNKLASANAAGFKGGTRGRGVSLSAPGAGKRTFSGVVELSNGLLYMQPIDSIAGTPERRTALGIQTAAEVSATEFLKLARGCKSKPGRVELELSEGGGTAVLPFSTAKKNDALALAGASLREDEFVEYE